MQHRAALVTDAPTMGGKRRPAAQEVIPTHAAFTVAQLGCGWPAWRQLGEINRVRGGGGKTQKAQNKTGG